MNFRALFEIARVGASLFSGGTVCVSVLMALYPELAVCSCQIIDSQPVVIIIYTLFSLFVQYRKETCFGLVRLLLLAFLRNILIKHSNRLTSCFILHSVLYILYTFFISINLSIS